MANLLFQQIISVNALKVQGVILPKPEKKEKKNKPKKPPRSRLICAK